MAEISYRAQKALRGMDLGESVAPDFFLKDLGRTRTVVGPGETETADTLEARTPLSRAQRERVPAQMAANLMDYYIENLNDDNMMNPIRDGIPQCRNHPFVQGTPKIGCIHSCAKKHPELTLPVVRDYTLGDVFTWVKALVLHAVKTTEIQKGWHRPADLTKR
jgi:hypothetical protein